MKKFVLLIIIIFLTVFTGYGQTVEYNLKIKRFEERQNVLYYKGSPFDGTLIKRYENGELSSKGSYKDGKKNGEWMFYYDNSKYIKYGSCQGGLKSSGSYKDGKADGKWEFYYDHSKYSRSTRQGGLKSSGPYKDGKKNGKWEFYYDSEYADRQGRLKSSGPYKDGKKNGKWEFYDEDGKLNKKEWYIDGKVDEILSYYKNSFADPKNEIVSILGKKVEINQQKQAELRMRIQKVNDLQKITKGEFEKEVDFLKRKDEFSKIVNDSKDATLELNPFLIEEKSLINKIKMHKNSILKLTNPILLNEKLSSIGSYNSEKECFTVELNGNMYMINVPVKVAAEFKGQYDKYAIYSNFPDSILRIEFKNYCLYPENNRLPIFLDIDGNPIPYVKIGSQFWMSENANVNYYEGTWSYGADNILYTWHTANKVCTQGWHLASYWDWSVLAQYIGSKTGNYTKTDKSWEGVGQYLKADTGWSYRGHDYSEVNEYGFSAIAGGYGGANWGYDSKGRYGYWWSSTEYSRKTNSKVYNTNEAWNLSMGYKSANLGWSKSEKGRKYSVRCIRD